MKLNGSYELHLAVKEETLSAGMEWSSRFSIWLVIQVESGTGYWMHSRQNLALEPGTTIVLPPDSDGSIRASQMGRLSFSYFCVDPMRLVGLLTLAEQRFFRLAAARDEFVPRILGSQHPLATELREFFENRKQTGSLLRLQLLQKFLEIFAGDLNEETIEPELAADAKQRLTNYLKTMQTFELVNLSFAELVNVSRCTPRHLSRIFYEVVGMSFRAKRAELRLALACELLASTELKILDVALESGFQSLSLFNLMFARRFGMSPGKWRQKQLESRRVGVRRPRRAMLLASAV
jgi:AraC-like DNA-binding protein